MEIIQAHKTHIPAIRAIVEATWPVAYGDILSPKQIRYMIDLFYSDYALAQQMESDHHFILLLNNGIAQGFAGFEHNHPLPAQSKLHKLYVHPRHQGKGIGRGLLLEVIRAAAAAGSTSLSLNVNRYNKAVMFYETMGFDIVKEEDIDIGDGFFMNDYVMELAL